MHVGSTAGAPWWDMWDTNIVARMHQIARDQILPLRDDPRFKQLLKKFEPLLMLQPARKNVAGPPGEFRDSAD